MYLGIVRGALSCPQQGAVPLRRGAWSAGRCSSRLCSAGGRAWEAHRSPVYQTSKERRRGRGRRTGGAVGQAEASAGCLTMQSGKTALKSMFWVSAGWGSAEAVLGEGYPAIILAVEQSGFTGGQVNCSAIGCRSKTRAGSFTDQRDALRLGHSNSAYFACFQSACA